MELFFWKGTGDDNWAAFPGDGRLLLQCGLMTNEQDLRQLIRHMRPEAHPGRYVFAVVPGRFRMRDGRRHSTCCGP